MVPLQQIVGVVRKLDQLVDFHPWVESGQIPQIAEFSICADFVN